MHILNTLCEKQLINPPEFVNKNLCLLIHGGSFSYGCELDSSDFDLFGVCVPDIKYIYHAGITGFDDVPVFNDYQQHGIMYDGIKYDIKIYSIVQFVKLCASGNPNILDILFAGEHCVLYQNNIIQHIRNRYDLFITKQCIGRYLGFANNHFKSNENRLKSGNFPESRKHLYDKFGYDTKDISHCIRALLTIRDMLKYNKYELDRHKNTVLAIKTGQLTLKECLQLRESLVNQISNLETNSKLPDGPDMVEIRALLVECLP